MATAVPALNYNLDAMTAMALRCVLAVGVAVLFEVGCGSPKPTSPSSTQPTTSGPPAISLYSGAIGASFSGKSGALALKTSVPTTLVGGIAQLAPTGTIYGALNTADGARVSLSGTLTSATGTMTVQGGGYQFTATANADGTVTGSGTFAGSAGLLALATGAAPIGVSATAVTASSAAQSYCGTYSGFYKPNTGAGNPEGGTFCLTISGTRVFGSGTSAGPLAVGDPAVLFLSGTASGGHMTASCTNCSASIDGRYDSSSASGSYVSRDSNGGSTGTWSTGDPIADPGSNDLGAG